MDAKEIKQYLKSARESIKNKDFKTALQLCKAVLKEDRNNYTGLVLFGVALQDTEQKDQAPKAFRKAIEASPKQLLAWQGLCSYYEKEGTGQDELVPVYQQLLFLESDVVKFGEICNKLALLCLKLSRLDDCVDILIRQAEIGSPEQKEVIWKTLVSVLSPEKDLSAELSAVLEVALRGVLKDHDSSDAEDYYKKYLRVLYRNKKYSLLLQEAANMHSLYPASEIPLEWMCKMYSEQVAVDAVESDNIEEIYKKLEALNSQSSLALLAKAAHFFTDKNFIEACDILKEVVGALSQSSYVWILLCHCYLHTHCYNDAEICAKEALSAMKKQEPDEHLSNLVVALLVKALSLQTDKEKLEETVKKCMKILARDPGNLDIIECLARAHVMLGNEHEADKCMQVIQNPSTAALLKSLLLRKQNRTEEALQILTETVQEEPNSVELWIELGKLNWEEERHVQSLTAFLKAAKLDPHSYVCYVHLGHYYRLQGRDLDKARRCYQKAFRLNPKCKEAGAGLSDLYRLQKNPEANIQLLTYVTETVGCIEAKWAWLRLGLHHMDQRSYQEAIESLLPVIRADPSDSYSWECLADAYYGRGGYTAALKSYQRVLELDSEAVYPAYQLGNIKQLLGLYGESVEDFKNLLDKHPAYVPALKGLGETFLCQARTHFSQQLLGCCRDCCQRAVDTFTKAVEERKDLLCLWKLMGDCCTLVAQLPERYGRLCMRTWLTDIEEQEDMVVLEKLQVFQQGIRCYCRALSLNADNYLLWHDLALIYNLQGDYMTEESDKTQLREHALAAIKKSVILNPRDWESWNLLGVIAASPELKNMELAQHAFIKAIQLEKDNAITWTNLGTLYLCLGDIKLAHRAFCVAQKTEPSYMQCWIGLALIAESLNVVDTMDLFRHTTQLGIHLESCIGYSHWVCTTLKSTVDRSDRYYLYSIERMHAIPVAGDCMTWYTGHIKNNACAFNMLGLLLERQRLYHGAAEAFEEALKVLRTGTKEDVLLSDMVHSNYARILVQLQQYEDAIQQYQEVKKADFYTQCGLAVALFKANKYEEAYSAYETALEWLAPTDGLKSHVLVAMAAMTYICECVEDSKTHLFRCIRLKPPSVQGLFAICSLGILHSDISLTELALKELVPYQDNSDYLTHIAVFKAYTYYISQMRRVEAVRAMSSTVHRHPGQPSLWLALALLLLNLYPERRNVSAANCAQISLVLGRSSMDVSKVMSLVSLSHLLAGKSLDSLRSSQKAVHMFPQISENWVVLIASFLPWCMYHRSAKDTLLLKRLIGHVRRKLDATREMTQWLSNHERKVTMLSEEFMKN